MKNQLENRTGESHLKPEDLMEEIGIKKDTYYRDVNFLGIEGIKDEDGKTWITLEDASRIKALRNYVQETGKREGFDDNDIIIKENMNENSSLTINENEENDSVINEQEKKSALITSNNDASQLKTKNSKDSALSTKNSKDSALSRNNSKDSVSISQNSEEDIYVTPSEPTENINVDGLVRGAAELKAREIAMPELVKRALADKLEEDDLPLDLQEKIGLAREAANPKFTPSMVAERLLAQYRLKRAG